MGEPARIVTLCRIHGPLASPRPTAEFFRGLAKEHGEDSSFAPEFLQSHPLSKSRAERFEAAANKTIAYRPALSDADFRALKTMCSEDG